MALDTVGIARLQMEIIFFLKQIMRSLVCSVWVVISVSSLSGLGWLGLNSDDFQLRVRSEH